MDSPLKKPQRPYFSSGPCVKYKGWSLNRLSGALLHRSHRSALGKAKLFQAIEETRNLLHIPDDYQIAIVPASDSGAVEMALWSLLGARGVDIFAWESFSKDWVIDVRDQLHIADLRVFEADYGDLPDLSQADFSRDVIFPWNGTTSGVRVPSADWIKQERTGLTICDATSAIFAQKIDWRKLDVATFSWQKLLGGEAAHGMLILSPSAIERLSSFTPPRPLPKIFRLTKKGQVNDGIFKGETINTPSMLCVEDYLSALAWVRDDIGGVEAMWHRADQNLALIADWVAGCDWIDFLAKKPEWRSNSSVCLSFDNPRQTPWLNIKKMVALLEEEEVAYDIASYRSAPLGLRIWAGGTVEKEDLESLLPWLEWAFEKVRGLS